VDLVEAEAAEPDVRGRAQQAARLLHLPVQSKQTRQVSHESLEIMIRVALSTLHMSPGKEVDEGYPNPPQNLGKSAYFELFCQYF
jgi:hypothetical protein